MKSKWKWPFWITFGIAVLLVGVSFFAGLDYSGAGKAEARIDKPIPTSSQTDTPSDDQACDAQFKQVEGNNASTRVDADFSTKYAEATAQAGNLSDAQRQLVLTNSANNAQRLAIWSHAFGLHESPNDWKTLVNGDCLSQEGQKLYTGLEAVLTAKGTTFKEAEAPANGYNSGVSDGTFGVSNEQGVSGDRKAILITLPDGSQVYLMVRCGNPVFPNNPGLPEVPTDNPPKPTTPPSTTPPTTPPSTTPPTTPPCEYGTDEKGNCKKSPNSTDYRQPGDGGKGADVGTGTKPQAPAPTTPAESTPAPVATQQTGGGGVVDTPTKAPGSETGGSAPGATPAPPTTRPVPAPEPSAPPATTAPSTCSPPPGMTTC